MWQTLFKTFPADQAIVWIRVLNIYGEPTLALFDETSQTFVVQMTGLIIPAYQVARWKSQ